MERSIGRLAGLRYTVLGLIAGLFLALAPGAGAQTLEESEYELRQIGQWSQAYTAFNSRAVQLMMTSESLNAQLDEFARGAKTAEELREALRAWRGEYDRGIAQMRADFAALPPPPRLRALAMLQPGLDAATRRSEQNIDQVAAFGTQMAELLDRVLSGETNAAAAVHERGMRIVRELLLFENGSLTLLQAMSPPGHPNHPMAASRITFNNSLVIVFDAYLRSAMQGAIVASVEQRTGIVQGAAEMRRHNEAGRNSVREHEAAMGATPFSPTMRVAVERMYASMTETFETLDRGAAILEAAAALRNGAAIDELEAVLDAVTALAMELDRQNMERASVLNRSPAPAL
jgi:hypothetical protein